MPVNILILVLRIAEYCYCFLCCMPDAVCVLWCLPIYKGLVWVCHLSILVQAGCVAVCRSLSFCGNIAWNVCIVSCSPTSEFM